MHEDDDYLLALADAVLDARPLDWAAIASRVPDDQRSLIAGLHSVADISAFHLESSVSARSATAASTSFSSGTGADSLVVAPSTQWGPLTLTGCIGRGRFGDVYRARDSRLDRPVALKLLRHQPRESDRTASAVVEEGRLMARVRHPNVVTVYGAERVDGRVGLWMELVDGRTLEEELRQRGPLPWNEVCRIGSELSQALAAVHRAGLLHRDLKAQNVLREISGRVVLADFGAGLILSGESEDQADVAGTPLYLAPEVFDGKPAMSTVSACCCSISSPGRTPSVAGASPICERPIVSAAAPWSARRARTCRHRSSPSWIGHSRLILKNDTRLRKNLVSRSMSSCWSDRSANRRAYHGARSHSPRCRSSSLHRCR